MSTLNFNRNTFLEQEELRMMQSMWSTAKLFNALKQASVTFGIVTNNPNLINSANPSDLTVYNTPLNVTSGSVAGSIDINEGMILDANGNFISIDAPVNMLVQNDGYYYWLKIAYTTRKYELGTVAINNKGMVSGSVDFTGKVRGNSTNTATRVRFEKNDGTPALNNNVYEVVNYIDSRNLLLTSDVEFVNENDLRIYILGTLPLGGIFSADQRAGLYTYDYYTLTLERELTTDVAPEKEDNEFFLARVKNNDDVMFIDNTKKTEYWSLGNIYKGGE